MVFLYKEIIIIDCNIHPFPEKLKIMKKNVKIIFCGNAVKNKDLEEDCAKVFKEIDFKFTSIGTPQKNGVL